MSPNTKYILLGALTGAALGGVAAWAYLKSQDTGLWTQRQADGRQLTVKAGLGDFARIGMAVFGIVRQIQTMARRA